MSDKLTIAEIFDVEITPEEKAKFSKEAAKRTREYFLKVYAEDVEEILSKEEIHKRFMKSFHYHEGKRFNLNLSREKYVAVMKFFLKDESFKTSTLFVQEIDIYGKKRTLKGGKNLLIIGDFGTSKTSILRAVSGALQGTNLSFPFYSAMELVDEFETLNSPEDKEQFWKKMRVARLAIDDVKRERIASNYGKKNVIETIIDYRTKHRLETYLTCNYSEQHPGDLVHGLLEFSEKYGGYILDRIFGFTILEFKGKSLR